MTDPTILAAAIAGAVGAVILAGTNAAVTIIDRLAARDDRKANQTERLAAAAGRVTQLEATHAAATLANTVDRKTDALMEKATEIHQTTNGNLSKLQGQLDVAQEEIRGLKVLMATILAAQDDAHTLRDAHKSEMAAAITAPIGGWQRRATDRADLACGDIACPDRLAPGDARLTLVETQK